MPEMNAAGISEISFVSLCFYLVSLAAGPTQISPAKPHAFRIAHQPGSTASFHPSLEKESTILRNRRLGSTAVPPLTNFTVLDP
jgi:hypothetical protein